MTLFYKRYAAELARPEHEFRRQWVELYEKYWPDYELGTLSLKEQRILRLQGLFARDKISTVEAEKRARFHNDAYESEWRLFEDALPLIDELSLRSEKIGIITNGNVERQRKKLERTGILNRFDAVIVSAAYGFAKPDPRIFHEACAILSARPEQSFHIGDNTSADVAGAAGAGLSAIWLDRLNAQTTPEVAHVRVESLTGLEDLLG